MVRSKESAAPVASLSWRVSAGVSAGVSGLSLEDSSSRTAVQEEQLAFNDQTVYSYQQISCLDSVIRSEQLLTSHLFILLITYLYISLWSSSLSIVFGLLSINLVVLLWGIILIGIVSG